MKQIICNKIDKKKIRKIKDVSSEKEWMEAVYCQFGFDTIDQLQNKILDFMEIEGCDKITEYPWYEKFYWSKKVEDEWIRLTLKQFEPIVRKLIKRGMWIFVLNWFPTSVRKDDL
jgi:hypothetical protein